jgi:heptosyltransferase III
MRRLLIRPGAIGDLIVSFPAMEFLRGDYTEIWAPSPVVPLIRFVDRVRPLSSTGIDLLELGDERARKSMEDFDDIVSWYGESRAEFREAVRDLPVRFFPALPDGSCHAVDFYSRQVGAQDGLTPTLPERLKPSGFIACHPFSGSARKNWPLERFREVGRLVPLCFCRGPEQESFEDAVFFPRLDELAEWLATANAYIGNDSGITHLAAAIGIPVVALFGPTDPAVWAPRGPRVTVVRQSDAEPVELAALLRRYLD